VQSDAWWNADLKIVELTRVFRQKDADLIERLNHMRKGATTMADIRWMNDHFYDRYQQQPQQQAFLLTQPVPSPASAASAGSAGSAEAVGTQEQIPDPGPLHLYPTNADVSRGLSSCCL
jgi:hypothetical protein